MELYSHQVKYAKGYPDRGFLVHEGGTGKTVCACVWLADGRDSDALVICPKKIVGKWQETIQKWGTKAIVVSKEHFKKMCLSKEAHKQWSALIIDEADEFASPLFVAKQRSQLSTALYELLKSYPDMPRLLLTATPIRSNPWNLHTLLCFYGHYIDYKKWRDTFFDLKRMPYLPRPAYIPKNNWRKQIRIVLEKYADIILLKDCINELPPITEHKIKIDVPKYLKAIDAKPFFDEHRWEQQTKTKNIIEIGKKYRKVLVVAYYRDQIDELEKELSKDKQVFKVYGGVKDQEQLLRQAQESDECYLIVQASLGAGFDADTFSCIVYASMSYAVRDFVQMNFRVRRIHNLHPVVRYYLLAGRCDKAILHNVEKGKDFVPSEWDAGTAEEAQD